MNYFPGLALNLDPPDLSLPVARITGLRHWVPGLKWVSYSQCAVGFVF
jgi:hypothetical protein